MCAVKIIARWEKPCGKFPIWRCNLGSYSSASRPRWLRIPSNRSMSCSASAMPAHEGVVVSQPEAAGQESALRAGEAVSSILGVVTKHESIPQQILLDRRDGSADPRVLRRQESEVRNEQQAGIQGFAAIRLGKPADLGVEPALTDSSWIRGRVSEGGEPGGVLHRRRCRTPRWRRADRSNATQAITFEWVK